MTQRRYGPSNHKQPTLNQRQWPGFLVLVEIYVLADGEDGEMKPQSSSCAWRWVFLSNRSERDCCMDTTLLEAFVSDEIVGCNWTHISADNLTEATDPKWAAELADTLDRETTSMSIVVLYVKILSCFSPHVTRMIKLQGMRWAGRALHMGKKMKNLYATLLWKHYKERKLIRWIVKETECKVAECIHVVLDKDK